MTMKKGVSPSIETSEAAPIVPKLHSTPQQNENAFSNSNNKAKHSARRYSKNSASGNSTPQQFLDLNEQG